MKFVNLSVLLLMLVQASRVFSLAVRINGGQDAPRGEFPFQISIQWGLPPFIPLVHTCGGTIIKSRWVLTAAHCATGSMRDFCGKHVVKVGVNDISVNDEFVKVHTIERKVIHEEYSGGVVPNDIALLLLATPIIFNERVAPVALPSQGFFQTGDAVISGWGGNGHTYNPIRSQILQTTTLPVVTNEECQTLVGAINRQVTIYPNQICTISPHVLLNQGDSGGPLVQNISGTVVQVGIVSWDLPPSSSSSLHLHSPSIYTRVSSFIDWINEYTHDF